MLFGVEFVVWVLGLVMVFVVVVIGWVVIFFLLICFGVFLV